MCLCNGVLAGGGHAVSIQEVICAHSEGHRASSKRPYRAIQEVVWCHGRGHMVGSKRSYGVTQEILRFHARVHMMGPNGSYGGIHDVTLARSEGPLGASGGSFGAIWGGRGGPARTSQRPHCLGNYCMGCWARPRMHQNLRHVSFQCGMCCMCHSKTALGSSGVLELFLVRPILALPQQPSGPEKVCKRISVLVKHWQATRALTRWPWSGWLTQRFDPPCGWPKPKGLVGGAGRGALLVAQAEEPCWWLNQKGWALLVAQAQEPC